MKNSGTAPTDCASPTVGNVMDFTYNFDQDPGAGVVNNGNLVKISNNLVPDRSQSFTYDELSRISTAQSQATSGGDCWGLSYGYDIWGRVAHPSRTGTAAEGAPFLRASEGWA